VLPKRARPPGNALARLREDAELTPSVAAEMLEMEEGELAAIEGATIQATTVQLANMARVYHVEPFLVAKAYLADRRK
jgi:hypothetical protein